MRALVRDNPEIQTIRKLQARIRMLEDELLRRPTVGEIERLKEKLRRKTLMCEAALARNEILTRKVREHDA